MIRKARKEDYCRVKELLIQVHKLHVDKRPDIYFDCNPISEEYFNNILNKEDVIVAVYEEHNEIVGLLEARIKNNFSILIEKPRISMLIETMVVDLKHRNKGIGKKLFTYIFKIAKEKNLNNLELGVWSFNDDAINFYEKMGMKPKIIKMEYFFDNEKTDLS